MLFDLGSAILLLAICSFSNATELQNHDILSNVTIYAYGNSSNGAPIFYDDGFAYIGASGPGWSKTATNITFTSDTSSTTVPWNISANVSPAPFTGTPSLYIIPSAGLSQVGFVASDGILPAGAVTTGFTWFGTSVAYVASSSNYEIRFWAKPSNETGVWGLYWNSDTTRDDGVFPVTLKRDAPVALSP
ncbi:MAG: hypothetical protein M1818_002178 [Claussenomyces sp. TS43310]|nr:MAG: hypothetical protein M1818_002178 [Claussenomyces sp. TS43310]